MAVFAKKLNGNVSAKGNLQFFLILIGIIIYGVCGSLLAHILQSLDFQIAGYIYNLLDVALAISLYLIGKRIYENKINEIKQPPPSATKE
jgi:hypothetical protein